jgi:hypothetical protein
LFVSAWAGTDATRKRTFEAYLNSQQQDWDARGLSEALTCHIDLASGVLSVESQVPLLAEIRTGAGFCISNEFYCIHISLRDI